MIVISMILSHTLQQVISRNTVVAFCSTIYPYNNKHVASYLYSNHLKKGGKAKLRRMKCRLAILSFKLNMFLYTFIYTISLHAIDA